MKRFDDAEVGLRTESPVGVDRLGIIGIKFAENVESVFGSTCSALLPL